MYKKIRKTLVLLIMLCAALPAACETMQYKIKQDGSAMVIVPYYQINTPSVYQDSNMQIKSAPAKIPYSERKLPKGKNRVRNV